MFSVKVRLSYRWASRHPNRIGTLAVAKRARTRPRCLLDGRTL